MSNTFASEEDQNNSDSEVHSFMREILREGAAQQLYQERPEIERWIDAVVTEFYDALNDAKVLPTKDGFELFKTFTILQLSYAELLAALTPLVTPTVAPVGQVSVSFVNVVIPEIRKAMMSATFRRFNADLRLRDAGPTFVDYVRRHANADHETSWRDSPSNDTQSPKTCMPALLIFNLCLSHLRQCQKDRLEAVESFEELCLFEESAVPYLLEYNRRALQDVKSYDWLPPQALVAVVDVAMNSVGSNIGVSFDSHTDTVAVLIGNDEFAEWAAPLGAMGLSDCLHFSAAGFVSARRGPRGKLFSSWEQRLVTTEQNRTTEEAKEAVERCVRIQGTKLATLMQATPELYQVINNDEPTIVVFDGAQTWILGTVLDSNSTRGKFFEASRSKDAEARDAEANEVQTVAAAAGIQLNNPELWFARRLENKSPEKKNDGTTAISTSEQNRREARRKFREVIRQQGMSNYRDFVTSLKDWDVIETTDGHGGHGSLKRTIGENELRAGTWDALRRSDRPVNFARMYEILENLEIPLSEYTARLSKAQKRSGTGRA